MYYVLYVLICIFMYFHCNMYSFFCSLSSLYLHYVATNDMLYVVSTVCTRLVILDISYSSQVCDV